MLGMSVGSEVWLSPRYTRAMYLLTRNILVNGPRAVQTLMGRALLCKYILCTTVSLFWLKLSLFLTFVMSPITTQSPRYILIYICFPMLHDNIYVFQHTLRLRTPCLTHWIFMCVCVCACVCACVCVCVCACMRACVCACVHRRQGF